MNRNFLSKTFLWDLSLLLVAIIWGGGFVVTKNALEIITPLYFLAFRFLISGVLMLLLFYKQMRRASITDIKNGSIIGIFLALGFITQTIGADYTTPAKSSFITGLNVVLVPFVLMAVTKKFPPVKSFITALVAFFGLGLLSLNETLTLGLGDSLTVLCAVFYACHIVSIGHFGKNSNPIVLATVQIVFTAIACSILALIFEPYPQTTSAAWGGILYAALFATILAFLIQNIAQKNTPSTHAAIILCLESVFGALASALFWGEVLTAKAIIGCVLIFGAILVNEVDFKQLFKGSELIEQGKGEEV